MIGHIPGCADVIANVTPLILHANHKSMQARDLLGGNGGDQTAIQSSAAKRTDRYRGICQQPLLDRPNKGGSNTLTAFFDILQRELNKLDTPVSIDLSK